jgi:hypothetical protein
VVASLPPDLAPDEISKRVASVLLPATDDGPSPAERAAFATCDAEALYYGIGVPTDDGAARKCAYAHDDTGILMMIYANGRGVPRNVDVAVRLACDFGGAPMELEGRIAHLRGRGTDAAAPGKEFDVCDDVTSGMMGGVCAAHAERMLAVARSARKRAAVKDLPATELGALDRAAAAFFDARANDEVDLSGTLRAALETQERAALEDAYVASLERVRSASLLPLPPASDFARADAELNDVYAQIMTGKKDLLGTVTRDGVRAAERLWLRYCDAWVLLGQKVRPEAPAQAWRAWLTRERVKMLRALVGE